MHAMQRCKKLIPVLVLAFSLLARADYYVAQNGQTPDPGGAYTNWMVAASNIQDAVNQVALDASETIWIDSGRYTVPTNAVYDYFGTNIVHAFDKKISFRGFSGDPADTIINGEGKYRGFAAVYDGSAPQGFTFDSLTISNCLTTNNVGGSGIYFYSGNRSGWRPWTSIVENCVFVDNQAVRGAGVHFAAEGSGRKVAFSNCVFRNNRVSDRGGAIWVSDGLDLAFTDCRMEQNRADHGAVLTASQVNNVLFDRCIVRGNITDDVLGCISLWGNHTIVRNTLVCNNSAVPHSSYGGIFNVYDRGILDLYNCTIVSNVAGLNGAVWVRANSSYGATCRVVNCVMDSNTDWNIRTKNTTYDFVYATNSCSSHTNYIPNFYADGNITNDPKFVNFDAGDFRLANGSPCLNAGTNLAWTADAVDLDGNPRRDTVFGLVDMGAYEHLYRGTLILVQ